MEALAGDLAYALIAFNGDLVGLTCGTHVSGNSLTAVVNGICGSLNLRCFFYDKFNLENFRRYVSLMTYGDDNIGSVSSDLNGFTIKAISEYLSQFGQIYTMPDKNSELVDFLPYEDFEFLKRSSSYIPELKCHLGALSEKSIFKSLHYYLRNKRSPLTEEMACAQNIDGAIREWFNHGRKVYNKRIEQMRIVAAQAEISSLCQELDVTFDARVELWRSEYAPE